MPSEPIIVTETEAREFRTVDREYTYKELLELFDDGTLVKPLVLRCQDYEQQLAARDAEIARCHEAICCLTGEVARLADVIRNLRAEKRDVEVENKALLEGFAWTAETAAFVRAEWDRDTERIIGGAE